MPEPQPIALSEEQAKLVAKNILACVQQADSDQAGRNDDIKEGRAFFLPRPGRDDAPWDGACEVSIPLCETTLLQWIARLDIALLCVDPLLRLNGPNKSAAGDAENFLQDFNRKKVRAREKVLPAFMAALRDGSSALYVTWHQEWREQTRWQTVEKQEQVGERHVTASPLTGEQIELSPDEAGVWEQAQPGSVSVEPVYEPKLVREGITEEVLEYDGPHLLLLETGYLPGTGTTAESNSGKARWGTYPAAGGDIQGSTGVFFRYSLTGDDINARVDAGEFDADAVETLRSHSGGTANLAGVADSQQGIASDNIADNTWQAKPVDLLEGYWRVSPQPNTTKGETDTGRERRERLRAKDYLITLHEDTGVVLRAIPNPWWHGQRPVFPMRPFRPTSGVHGTSVPDLIGDAQETMTQILRDGFDMAQKCISPPLKIKRGLLAFSERRDYEAQNKPRGIVEVDYPDSVQVMAEGLGDPMAGIPAYQIVKDFAQVAIGINDQSAGLIKGNVTATEVRRAQSEGDALFQHVRQNLAEDLERIGDCILKLCYQFVGNQSVQDCWRAANPDNQPPQPGLVPGEWELSPEQGYVVSAWGTSEASNRALNRANWEAGFKVLSTLPEQAVPIEILATLPPDVVEATARRQYALHRGLTQSVGTGDPDDFIGTEDDYLKFVTALVQSVQAATQQARAQAEAEAAARQNEVAAQGEQANQGVQAKFALGNQAHQNKVQQMQLAAQLQQEAQPPQETM